ncbi:putative SP-containing membrane protein [Vairimorpha necatrix]|uniref:SP-containing membrane protein n=1 Tax=Vairimorpha necatrix TaxID=6039 RepID=A0AAX4JD45_9MICR
MRIFFYFAVFFCSTPLNSPFFKKRNGIHYAELPFSRTVDLKSYEIMVGKLDAKENDYISVDKRRDQSGMRDGVRVKLDSVKNKNNKQLYSICIEEMLNKKAKKWYSEPFRFDSRNKRWVLDRVYEEDPWYVEYQGYVIGASVLAGLGLIAMIIKRYIRNKNEEEYL